MARGKLVVFEGLDRAGKTTQYRSTATGKAIDAYLKGESEQEDHVIHLLFSINRWEKAASIEADIQAGTTVIIDRYYYSGCVYSAAKDNPTLDLRWARHPEVGLPRPDICIFLDISAEDVAKRGSFGEEKYETRKMQERVRELFGVLQSSPEGEDFVKIDAGASLDSVEQRILEAVDAIVARVDTEGLPLRRVGLW
ncbi:Thymidylate kinase [Coniosporium apollinis]|uniref:dTMP kinase n=1 Tax=Coniosporium apollinis TaxID=61459 RepID=A0ABQ9NQK7_9PEZI|nr:Thymidylate kinase [Coniosporium apollinis]